MVSIKSQESNESWNSIHATPLYFTQKNLIHKRKEENTDIIFFFPFLTKSTCMVLLEGILSFFRLFCFFLFLRSF